MKSLSDRYRATKQRLDSFGQSHVLSFWDSLNDVQREKLLEQCDALPLDLLRKQLTDTSTADAPAATELAEIEPAWVVRADDEQSRKYRDIGEEMIRAGRVACFTVAGGQGTRLGWNGPKGTFPATPILHKPLFQVFAESILAARRRWRGQILWYLMTSPLNHQETQDFFRTNDWFQLGEESVRFFMQGTLPSISLDGKILLSATDSIALNPDGHGGAIRALASSGSLNEMRARGIDTLSYFQVDNPLVKVVDPLFLGLHASHPESSAEVSSKAVAKRDPSEKVGIFCRRNKRTVVLEYIDLPARLAQATNADGTLMHSAGSIAIHAFSRAFLERLAGDAQGLPLHRALKKVQTIDRTTGAAVEASTPNAIKMEAFIFDAVPLATRSLVYETQRDEEFAPIKNAHGEDSPATSQLAQSQRAARWLAACGVEMPSSGHRGECDATIELSPLTALDPEDLARCGKLPRSIAAGAKITL